MLSKKVHQTNSWILDLEALGKHFACPMNYQTSLSAVSPLQPSMLMQTIQCWLKKTKKGDIWSRYIWEGWELIWALGHIARSCILQGKCSFSLFHCTLALIWFQIQSSEFLWAMQNLLPWQTQCFSKGVLRRDVSDDVLQWCWVCVCAC